MQNAFRLWSETNCENNGSLFRTKNGVGPRRARSRTGLVVAARYVNCEPHEYCTRDGTPSHAHRTSASLGPTHSPSLHGLTEIFATIPSPAELYQLLSSLTGQFGRNFRKGLKVQKQ